jgi:protein SCO1
MADVEPEVVASAVKPGAPSPAPGAKPSAAAELPEQLGHSLNQRIERLVGRPWFWVVSIGILFLVLLGSGVSRSLPKAPAKLYELPAFTLLNERGERFGGEDLKGRIWVADFIFTSCAGPCPKLTKRMAEIQHRARNLGDAFHLVTFTVDPETDTPERLADYAKKYHADPRRWTFLTGPLDDITTLAVKGFKEATGREEPSLFGIAHSERLALVDPRGWIRGYYEATDEGITDLLHDAGVLANLP